MYTMLSFFKQFSERTDNSSSLTLIMKILLKGTFSRGVVVASSLMRLLLDGGSEGAVLEAVAALRGALDGAA